MRSSLISSASVFACALAIVGVARAQTSESEPVPASAASDAAPVTAETTAEVDSAQVDSAELTATAVTAEATTTEVATPALLAAETPADDEPEAEAPAPRDDEFGLRANLEIGFTGVLAHEITLSNGGTRIDYVNDVNQSNLYLFLRLQVELDIWRQHIITFLYQPLDIVSQASAPRDLTIDGLVFTAGEPIQARYGFPFFRLGWAFDVLEGRDEELAFGLGLQIRNATIEFRSLDGELYRTRTDVGPVPLLRARGRFHIQNGWFFAFEIDGFWSPIPGLNGSDNGLVEGAIVDASVRLGWRFFPHVDGFVNVRYLAGGADGTGDPTATSDGFQANWLHFLNISLGTTFDTRP